MHIKPVWFLAIAAACGPAFAQVQPGGQVTRPATNATERERIVKATQLPKKTEEVRSKGVPDGEVKEALEAAKAEGVSAGEMADVTGEQSKAIDEHGRIDNFGAFVKSKLNEGLRGRELAAAIHAEHAKRGMGPKGKKAAKPSGQPDKGAKEPQGEKSTGNSSSNGKSQGKPDKAKGKPDGK